MRNWTWALALMLAFAATSHAQLQRFLPADGKLGRLSGQQNPFPLLQIDGQTLRLAPGGRIFDQHNRTIVHGFLPGDAVVLFVEDGKGDVALLYILSPGELERLQRPSGR
jgi:non-ribosomal peptide synthetase component F